MKFALTLSLVVAIVFGCKTEPSVWRGIPDGAICGRWDDWKTTCIVDGQAYLCVDGDRGGCRVDAQCAPVSLDNRHAQ